MAITVRTTPSKLQPVMNEISFSFSDVDVTAIGFKWVCDVYVAGIKIARLTKQPTNGLSQYFDISRILKSYLSYDSNMYINDVTAASNSIISYSVQLGTYTTAGGYVMSVVSGNRQCYNGYIDRNSFNESYNASIYHNDTTPILTLSQFLTGYNISETTLDTYGTIGAFNRIIGTDDMLVSGMQIMIDGDITKQYLLPNTLSDTRVDYPLHAKNINSASGATHLKWWNGTAWIVYGGANIITSTTSYYDVWLQYDGNDVTLKHRVYLKDGCTLNDVYSLTYLNKQGSFYTHVLDGLRSKAITTGKSMITTKNGTYNQSTYANVYSSNEFENKSFNTVSSNSYIISTGFINPKLNESILEMFSSPVVYLFINSYNDFLQTYSEVLKPVVVKDETIKMKTQKNNKMIEYTFEVTESYITQTQSL